MEFDDIIKIIAVIAFFVVSTLFDSKKKKQKREATRRRSQENLKKQNETQYNESSQPQSNAENQDDFFAEVRRMLEEAEEKKTLEYRHEEEPVNEFESSISQTQSISSVKENYFEEEYEEEEEKHFPKDMPAPEEEALTQTNLTQENQPIETLKKKQKPKVNLKQAIKHQVILERKFS